MKNKLFIVLACLALMAVGGRAIAQPTMDDSAKQVAEEINMQAADSLLTNRTSSLERLSTGLRLVAPTLDMCGNGTIDEDANGNKEQCDFVTLEDGTKVEITSTPTEVFTRAVPPTVQGCPEDTSCNPETCRCERTPYCGDGIVDHSIGHQCESVDKEGNALTAEKITMLCQRSKTAGLPVPDSTAYACDEITCKCKLCGNGIVDPGEDCDGTEGCNNECKMAPPVVKCSITTYGWSNDAAKAYIDPFNARTRAAIGMDLIAEEIHGTSLASVYFPQAGEIDANGEVKANDIAIIHRGPSAKLVRLDTMSFRPLREEGIIDSSQSVLLYPFGADVVPVVEGLTPLTKESMSIDLDKVAPSGHIDLNAAYGDVVLDVVNDKQGAVNKRIRFNVQVKPPVTKAVGEKVGEIVDLEWKGAPAPATYVGEQTVISHDPEEVARVTEEVAAEYKEAGKDPVNDCEVLSVIFSRLGYDPIYKTMIDVVSGDKMASLYTVSQTTMKVGGGSGSGAGCSIASAQANPPQVMIALSMLAVAITGVGIVRRRKR